jgi:hypothetical protein
MKVRFLPARYDARSSNLSPTVEGANHDQNFVIQNDYDHD